MSDVRDRAHPLFHLHYYRMLRGAGIDRARAREMVIAKLNERR